MVSSHARAVARWFGGGLLAVATVIASGVWLGHRLDPTWARLHAPLRRALPFELPAFVVHGTDAEAISSRAQLGRAWLLELRFPGCASDDQDVTARLAARARAARALERVTLAVGAFPGSANLAGGGRLLTVDGATFTAVAAQLGLAESARSAEDGLIDARHWLFAIDAGGWVRAATEVGDDAGWAALGEALAPAVAAPLRPDQLARPTQPAPAAHLGAFAAVDQDGRPVSARDLAGHRVVADFIFTRCMGACPMLTARLAALRRMVTDPEVRFVSFSVDPAHDTPAVLRSYAARWGQPDPRWRLVSADAGTVRSVARSLGELVVQDQAGPDGPILHSDRFTLIDGTGAIVDRFGSADPAELRRLASMLGAVTMPAALGARLFSSLGCQGCHDNAAIAPRLGGVAGRAVRLADGRTVAADDGYLRQSIVSPLAAVVDGFGATMPSYGGLLSDRELGSLVDYLKSLPH